MQLFSLLFVCSLILKEKGTQSAVVQTLDRAIHWINFKETICVIWWKVIYPGYGAIHLNNNWGLVICSADQIFITINTFYCMSESSCCWTQHQIIIIPFIISILKSLVIPAIWLGLSSVICAASSTVSTKTFEMSFHFHK